MRKYKTTGNTTLFDKEDMERKLTEMGDLFQRFVDYLNGTGCTSGRWAWCGRRR